MRRLPVVFGLLVFISLGCSGNPLDTAKWDDIADACEGLSLDDLAQMDDISDECRDAINGFLSGEQTNAYGKIIFLGSEVDSATGELVVYLHGMTPTGDSVSADDVAGGSLVVTVGGVETTLVSGQFTAAADPASALSVSLVTDYSASMREEDLDLVADMYTDLIGVLPPGVEGEALVFSDTVIQQQSFTEDLSSLSNAVTRDDSVERGSTALYDGTGTGAADLLGRDRPARLLVVATDGLENASTIYSKSDVQGLVDSNHLAVVMLGTLFSDVDEMTDLVGPNGIFIYAADYVAVRAVFDTYLQSLDEMVEVRAPADYASASAVTVQVGELSATLER